MTIDPKYFTLPSYLIDAGRFSSIVNSALDQSRINALSAITATVDATSALRSALYPSADLLSSTVTPLRHFESAAASLASLSPAVDILTSLHAPFAGTINALATLGSIGVGMQQLANSPLVASHSVKLPELSLGAAAYQVGIADSLRLSSAVTTPYLGSSAAVLSLETSYSKLLSGQLSGLASIQSSVLPSYVTSLQAEVLDLSTALKDTWASLGSDVTRLSTMLAPILRAPGVELYSAAQVAAAVSLAAEDIPEQDVEIEEILDEAVESFESRLAALHQGLVTTYRGADEALENGGTDWQRLGILPGLRQGGADGELLARDETPTGSVAAVHGCLTPPW